MSETPFEIDIARMIWESRYRLLVEGGVAERSVEESWRRVARAVAGVEGAEASRWEEQFYALLKDFRFLPGGRILAGAGTGFDVTLFNCFVMGTIDDSMAGIFDALKEGAITMQQGGGVGYDFSPLRPAGAPAWRVGGVASGPVSFMRIWDGMCQTLLSTATRRGAMMATLRCDHPDIEAFIDAKRAAGELTNFNLSVLVTDALVEAVKQDDEWPLVFPVAGLGGMEHCQGGELVEREWPGQPRKVPCLVIRKLRARDLWQRLMRASYETSEPGVLFIDRINRENNLGYREHIAATNPCGEIPLPPYGACNLGSLNLTGFVREPFSDRARIDLDDLAAATAVAVRLLDNVIDLSHFPLPQQREQALASRRLGLGVTGLADALVMLGLHYGGDAARQAAAQAMRTICHSAYRASIVLAAEKGSYPLFDPGLCLERPFIRRLPEDVRQDLAQRGLRNSHLLAIAPTGTISLLANNISSGMEPVFDFEYRRRIRGRDGLYTWHDLQDYALRHWRQIRGNETPPEYFVSARELAPGEHLAMQAALQPFVDNAISKTINVPAEFDFDAFRALYLEAHRLGLKGCTVFRPVSSLEAVLEQSDSTEHPAGPHCCGLDRESD